MAWAGWIFSAWLLLGNMLWMRRVRKLEQEKAELIHDYDELLEEAYPRPWHAPRLMKPWDPSSPHNYGPENWPLGE